MRTKTTIIMFVLSCILLGLVWLMQGNTQKTSSAPCKLLPVEADKVTRIAVVNSSLDIECARSEKDWALVRPVKANANAAALNRILRALDDLKCVETITTEQRRARGLTLDDYGVGTKPRAKLTLGNARTNIVLLLGRDALDDILYTRFANEDSVLTTTTAILAVLPQNADDLRDRNLIRGDIAQTSRLEINRPSSGFMQAARKDGQWTMQQPVKGARLNNESIAKLLRMLYGAQAERFVAGVDAAETGLDDAQAAVRVAVWTGNDTAGQRLLLGKEVAGKKDECYARLADGESACTVRKDILDAFTVKISDLRDSTVFPMSPADVMFVSLREGERKLEFRKNGAGWLITEPRRMKTDPAVMNELLTKLCAIRVEEFMDLAEPSPALGLSPALRSIELSTALPPEGEAAGPQKREPELRKLLLMGNEAPDSRGFYARFEDEPSILRICDEPTASLLSGRYSSLPIPFNASTNATTLPRPGIWIDPLLYCNRTMLEFDRESIVGISLYKDGREQTIRKDETGAWQPVVPLSGKVNAGVVKDTLDAASRLDAMEIKRQGAEHPASYGLDESAARLTFGMADGKGIRKTLLIGFRAGSEGVYAMIQGQDVIFVLPRGVVGKLLRDLVPEEEHGS